VDGLAIDKFSQEKMKVTEDELAEEKGLLRPSENMST